MGQPSSTPSEAESSKSKHRVGQSLKIVWELDPERGADDAVLRAFEMIFPGEISMNAEFDKIDGQVHE
jgi:hypothetical protein